MRGSRGCSPKTTKLARGNQRPLARQLRLGAGHRGLVQGHRGLVREAPEARRAPMLPVERLTVVCHGL